MSRRKLTGRVPHGGGIRALGGRDAASGGGAERGVSPRVSWHPAQERVSPGWKLMKLLMRRSSTRSSSNN